MSINALHNVHSAQSSEESLARTNLVRRYQEPELNTTKDIALSFRTGSSKMKRQTLPIKSRIHEPNLIPEGPQTILVTRTNFRVFWWRVANKFISATRTQSTRSELPSEDSNNYSLTRPELMDDDLDIDYANWKKRPCCHQFSNPKLEQYFWTFWVDNHTNTIQITFMAFLAFPILGFISVDVMQKGVDNEIFYNILYLRVLWSLVIMLFLLFFYIGKKHFQRLDALVKNQINHHDEVDMTFRSTSGGEMEVGLPFPWYERVGALTVSYTSYFVFAVSFVSCVISILISYIGNHPSHKPYIILFLVMHIFLGMGNNFCSFLCWMTTLMFCTINSLLVESPYKQCFYVVGSSVIMTIMGEFLEFSYRKQFYKRKELELVQFKNDLLLTAVVPPRIAIQLKRGEREAVSYSYEKPIWGASVLFCQICDFEQLSNELDAAALVNYLNKVFTYIDRLSTKNKVYKVETVKEVYMAASGLPEPNGDHMNQIAHFALDIKESLIETPERLVVNSLNFKSPTLKIGIHCGTVIAGVIGKLCPRYRLFGDTVNVAARMETNSKKGMIQISKRFREKIDDSVFQTVDRGFIKIKGKDSMHTYFLTGRKFSVDSLESVMHRSVDEAEAVNEISILKFCFDRSRLSSLNDGDTDFCEWGQGVLSRSIKNYRLQRNFSVSKIRSRLSFKKSSDI